MNFSMRSLLVCKLILIAVHMSCAMFSVLLNTGFGRKVVAQVTSSVGKYL